MLRVKKRVLKRRFFIPGKLLMWSYTWQFDIWHFLSKYVKILSKITSHFFHFDIFFQIISKNFPNFFCQNVKKSSHYITQVLKLKIKKTLFLWIVDVCLHIFWSEKFLSALINSKIFLKTLYMRRLHREYSQNTKTYIDIHWKPTKIMFFLL